MIGSQGAAMRLAIIALGLAAACLPGGCGKGRTFDDRFAEQSETMQSRANAMRGELDQRLNAAAAAERPAKWASNDDR